MHGIVRRSSSFNRWRIEHLIQDPAIYGKKLFLHYADLSDDASLRRIFQKLNQMSSIILPVRVMWASVLRFLRSLLRKLPTAHLNYSRYAGIRTTRPRSIWPVLQRFLEILRILPRMKIHLSIPLLLMGWQKHSVCIQVIYIGSLINYLSVMVYYTTTNLHAVAKTLLLKNCSWGSIYCSR